MISTLTRPLPSLFPQSNVIVSLLSLFESDYVSYCPLRCTLAEVMVIPSTWMIVEVIFVEYRVGGVQQDGCSFKKF